MGKWNIRERKCRKPAPPPPKILHQELPTGEPTLPDGAALDNTVRKIQRTKPNTRGRGAGRSQNRTTTNSIQNQNTRPYSKAGRDPNAGKTPHTSWKPSGNPDVSPNPSLNPYTGLSPRRNRNTDCNARMRGNRSLKRNTNG